MSRTRVLAATIALNLAACADLWGFQDLGDSTGGSASGGGGANGIGGAVGDGGAPGSGGAFGRGGAVGSGGTLGSGGAAGSGGTLGSGGATGAETGTGEKVPTPDGGSGGAPGSGGSPIGAGGTPGTGGQVQIEAAAPDGQTGNGGASGGGGMAGAGGQGGAGGLSDDGGPPDGAAGTGGREAGGTGGVPDGGGCIGVTRELLTNGSFEQGETGWAVSVAGGFPIVYAANGNAGTNMPEIAAQSAPNLTWIDGYNRADDSITQSVTLPADATSMTLSFFYSIFTRETGSVANDVMDVTVVAGTQTLSLAHFSNLDVVETWTRLAIPLPSNLAGQTVSVRFHGTTNATLLSSFYIDTLSLSVVACP